MRGQRGEAFSLIELLIVISIISIIASLVIAAFSNAAQDTRDVLARQQQVVVQAAVNGWVAMESSGTKSLSVARSTYNATTNGLNRLALVSSYLDEATYDYFTANTTNANQLQSEVMVKTSTYLTMPDWEANSYPKVELGP